MPTSRDPWGEPIERRGRTYSLAALFRAMTITGLAAGWIVVVVNSTMFVPTMPVVTAFALATVVAYRQPGRPLNRIAVFIGFFTGVLFVTGYVPAVLQYGPWSAVLLIPAVVAVAFHLIRAWVYLANVAAMPGKVGYGSQAIKS